MEPGEEPYKNREIREMVDDVRNSLTRIELQTSRTNGRVTNLEKWQYIFMGAISILTVIVIPLLGWALFVLSDINNVVHRSVNEALQAYDITK